MEFAYNTANELVSLEQTQLGFPSGLNLFFRMDIGVMRLPRLEDGYTFQYWVNEVDRTPNASLFACGVSTWAETLSKDFADSIVEYV
jgi:hypothetical protein